MTPQNTSQSEQHSRRPQLEVLFETMLESYENRSEGTSERIQETLSVAEELDAKDIIALTLLLQVQYNIQSTDPKLIRQHIEDVQHFVDQTNFQQEQALRIKATLQHVRALYASQHDSMFAEARDHWLEAIKYEEMADNKLSQSISLLNVGIMSNLLEDPERAIDSFKQALQVFPVPILTADGEEVKRSQQLKARRIYAQIYFYLAYLAAESSDFDTTISYLNEALTANTSAIFVLCPIYALLAESLLEKGDVDGALHAVNRSISMYDTLNGAHDTDLRSAISIKGVILLRSREYEAAVSTFEQALSIDMEFPGRSNKPFIYANLASAYASLASTDRPMSSQVTPATAARKARESIAKAEEYLPESSPAKLRTYHEYISEAMFLIGDTDSAYKYLRLAKKEFETDYSANTRNKIASLRLRMQVDRHEHEKEIEQMKRGQLEQELANSTMHLAMQTELLGNFRNDLRHIIREIDEPINALKKIKEKLKELPCEQIDWLKFEKQFTDVHPEFRTTLLEQYPDLTKQEVKMCQLARLGLKSIEMAQLLCLSERSIESHRYTLRKKLAISSDQNLTQFLATIR